MYGIVAMHQALHQAFWPSEIYGASLRVTQALLSFIYFRMKRSIIKKMFWHKNGTSKPQTLNQICKKKIVWNSTARGLGFPVAQKQLKMTKTFFSWLHMEENRIMSKQPEKPWGAWLFNLFAFLRHPRESLKIQFSWTFEPMKLKNGHDIPQSWIERGLRGNPETVSGSSFF